MSRWKSTQGCQRTVAGLATDLRPYIRSRFPNPPNRNYNLRFEIAPFNRDISKRSDLGLKHP